MYNIKKRFTIILTKRRRFKLVSVIEKDVYMYSYGMQALNVHGCLNFFQEPSHEERGALPHIINEDMAVMSDYELHTLCECYKVWCDLDLLCQCCMKKSIMVDLLKCITVFNKM